MFKSIQNIDVNYGDFLATFLARNMPHKRSYFVQNFKNVSKRF